MTTTAFSSPSGGYRVVNRRGYNAAEPSQVTPWAAYWRTAAAKAGLILAAFAVVIGGLLYPSVWAAQAHTGLLHLVLAAVVVLSVLAGFAFMAAWQERRIADQLDTKLRLVEDAVVHACAGSRKQTEAHEKHQAELLLAVREECRRIATAVDGRLTALEQRVEDTDQHVSDLSQLVRVFTTEEDRGNVLPLNGGPRPRRPA